MNSLLPPWALPDDPFLSPGLTHTAAMAAQISAATDAQNAPRKIVTFNIEQTENGYIINQGTVKYIAKDHDEVLEAVTLLLVRNKLSDAG